MNTIKIAFKSIFIFIAILFVIILVQAFLAFIGISFTKNPADHVQLFLERIYAIIVAFLLIYWSKRKRKRIYDKLVKGIQVTTNNLYSLVLILLIALSILFASFLLAGFLNQYQFVHWGIKKYPAVIILKRFLLVGILGNFCVAIGEEIIFRGFLMNYIVNISKSKLFALIFTSFVFTLHPYQDFFNYLIAFISGLILGYAYFKFKSLYIPIGIHYAYNIFNITIASDPGHGPELPYLIKYDYFLIKNGIGARVDLFIIFAFLMIFIFLFNKKPKSKKLKTKPTISIKL